MKEKIILIGGGGHCKSCIDVIESEGKYKIEGIVDKKDKLHSKILDYEIIATDDDLEDLIKDYKYFFITIGQIKKDLRRLELFNFLSERGVALPVIISPFASISKFSNVQSGSIVMHNVIINSNVEIGANCIINTGAIIEHDSVIKNHCHVSTGAIINGGCNINDNTFVGSNATIIEGITVGKDIIIGAGSLVNRSIETSGVYIGSPVKLIKEELSV